MTRGVLALLGSGETGPGMTKVHRALFQRLGNVQAVSLDTSYGFQENVPQMTEKLTDYFATSLQVAMKGLHFTSYGDSTPLERSIFKREVRDANYVFSGPGSPSYALAQWRPLDLTGDLEHVLENGGTLCFASAAALTLGAFTAPIYEIYKAGSQLYWLEGLDVLSSMGLHCAIIPHFDNQEGGNYDTSRCYLGERRLSILESQLPADIAILGVDEHTALILDFEAGSLEVRGRSNGYWRVNGETMVLTNGSTTPLEQLKSTPTGTVRPAQSEAAATIIDQPTQLGQLVADGGSDALDALAQLVQLATKGGDGFIDPAPLVEGVLAARVTARTNSQYELADQLRDALIRAGIDVQDGPDGSVWSIRSER